MKKTSKFLGLALTASVLFFSSCQEDENLEVARSLSGLWELTSVSILEDGQWTDLDVTSEKLFFEVWEDRNQNALGYRELANGDRVEFEYIVSGADLAGSPTTVSLLTPSEAGMSRWQGSYDVVALSSVLTLESGNDDLIIKAKRPK